MDINSVKEDKAQNAGTLLVYVATLQGNTQPTYNATQVILGVAPAMD